MQLSKLSVFDKIEIFWINHLAGFVTYTLVPQDSGYPKKERIGQMPIYEYRCSGCERQFQSLVIKKGEEEGLVCPGCGGHELKRLISRVAYHVSEGARLEAYDPKACHDDSFYKDSRNIGLHAQKRAQQMGVDLGSGFEAKLDKLRTDPGGVLRESD